MGRFDEALVMLKRSTAIRPTYAAVSNIATLEFYLGRYAESARSLERAVQLDGGSYEIWYNLAAAYYWAPGERDRSRAAYERAVELGEKARRTNPRDAPLLATLADSYAHLGQAVLARKLAGDAVRLAPAEGEVLFQAAGVFEYLGERERALGLVRRALDSGYSAEEISRAPNMAGLRADPRFAGRG
jgi:serine/threonine-protein kinase